MKATWFPGKLVALNEAECHELISAKEVGRIAWNDTLGPVVLPVNYIVDEAGDIRFRTEPGSALAYQLDCGTLTFQVDDVDETLESGWSVLIRGIGRHVHAPSDPAAESQPWAAGERDYHARLTPRVISGRRIIPA